MGARWRGSGHGYLSNCGSFIDGKPRKLLKKFGYLFPSRQAARRDENRHADIGEGLVPRRGTKLLDTPAATLGVLGRLEVTHINFLFLLFAHITFPSWVFGFGLCQSRRIVVAPRPRSGLKTATRHW
jgi:hypothetical protein